MKCIHIPSNVTSIGSCAFDGCENLNSIYIPNRVTRIENSTFKNCKNLKSITLSDHITSIGIHAFSHCRNLKSIEIPDSVTKIDIGACIDTGLEDITIPNRVAFIGEFAFGYLVQMNADYHTSYIPQKGFTIRGVTGSAAERYAMDNKIIFQSVGKPPETQEVRQNAFSGPSDWAKDEVEAAVAENIITQKFYDTVPYYTAPISRGGFAELAVNTSAVCYGFSDYYGDVCPCFYELFFNCHTDPKGNPYLPSKTQDGREAIYRSPWRTLFQDYPFTDVGPESYPNTARKTKITAAKLMGIIHAYEDGSFHPDQIITRQQAATMIGKYIVF